MAIEEDGRWSIITMWCLSALVLVFVVLRIYTRIFLLHCFGSDDVAYMVAYLFIIAFCVIMTISAYYGFGQSDIANPNDEAMARFYEGLGINIVGTGMIIAKLSIGLFLLRIVHMWWQKIAIWGVMALLLSTSLVCVVFFWKQCEPVAYIWDRQIKGGTCTLDFIPSAYLVTATCVFVDFFFAIFPWTVIWNLRMNRREKIVILSSLSLGVIAGACGIKRTVEIGKLARPDFLKATVPAAVWSAAEMAVTMVCIGVPVCLPFFRRMHDKWTLKDLNSATYATDIQHHSGKKMSRQEFVSDTCTWPEMARRLRVIGTLTETLVESRCADEEIPLHEYGNSPDRIDACPRPDKIHVRDEYMVIHEASPVQPIDVGEGSCRGMMS